LIVSTKSATVSQNLPKLAIVQESHIKGKIGVTKKFTKVTNMTKIV